MIKNNPTLRAPDPAENDQDGSFLFLEFLFGNKNITTFNILTKPQVNS